MTVVPVMVAVPVMMVVMVMVTVNGFVAIGPVMNQVTVMSGSMINRMIVVMNVFADVLDFHLVFMVIFRAVVVGNPVMFGVVMVMTMFFASIGP